MDIEKTSFKKILLSPLNPKTQKGKEKTKLN